MLHANMELMNKISAIDTEITKLTAEWRQLNERLEDACEAMHGKSPAEKKAFDDSFSVTFRSECDRIDEIETIVKYLRKKQDEITSAHYANL